MVSVARSGADPRRFRLRVGDEWFAIEVQDAGPGTVRVLVNDEPVEVELETVAQAAPAAPPRPSPAPSTPSRPVAPVAPPPPVAPPSVMGDAKRIVAPMPGRMISVGVKPGDQVSPGDEVCVMEAMKMEQSIRASAAGVVKEVHAQPGQIVAAGAVLVDLE